MQRSTSSLNRPGATKRLAIGLATLAMMGVLVAPANAQEEPDIKTYVGETYDFSLEWDRDVWNSSTSVSFGDQESVSVSTGTTTVEIVAGPAAGQSVQDCIDTAVEDIQDTPEYLDPEIVNDIETPGDAGDDGVTMVYGELLDGRESPVEIGRYITCAPVFDDGMLLIQVDTRLGIWGEEIEIVDALLATLEIGE